MLFNKLFLNIFSYFSYYLILSCLSFFFAQNNPPGWLFGYIILTILEENLRQRSCAKFWKAFVKGQFRTPSPQVFLFSIFFDNHYSQRGINPDFKWNLIPCHNPRYPRTTDLDFTKTPLRVWEPMSAQAAWGRICMIVATFLYFLAMLLAYLGLLKIFTFKPFIPYEEPPTYPIAEAAPVYVEQPYYVEAPWSGFGFCEQSANLWNIFIFNTSLPWEPTAWGEGRAWLRFYWDCVCVELLSFNLQSLFLRFLLVNPQSFFEVFIEIFFCTHFTWPNHSPLFYNSWFPPVSILFFGPTSLSKTHLRMF